MKLNKPKPPTAYRAIEFWQKHGFIHRIESLNAYTACKAGHHHQGSQFMICNDCGHVTEAHSCDIPQPLKDNIENGAFQASHWNLEVHGVCAKCV
jgi:Fur family zinc uptake transcriptional regulator